MRMDGGCAMDSRDLTTGLSCVGLLAILCMPASTCVYGGRTYAEGAETELCGPADGSLAAAHCPQATVVLPVYQCKRGRWKCVRWCFGNRVGKGGNGKDGLKSLRDQPQPQTGKGGSTCSPWPSCGKLDKSNGVPLNAPGLKTGCGCSCMGMYYPNWTGPCGGIDGRIRFCEAQ